MIPALFFVMNFALEFGFSPVLFILLVPAGLYFPRFYASQQKKLRETSVRADLPFFADLLALSTEAGLDFIGAIQRIVDKAENSTLVITCKVEVGGGMESTFQLHYRYFKKDLYCFVEEEEPCEIK
jgi:Flp pilus assembly protein TadB